MLEADPVRRATPSEADRVAEILGRAFADDPVYVWFMRRGFPLELLVAQFRGEVGDYLETGEVYVTADLAGAALWRPAPGAQPSPLPGLVRAIPALMRFTGPARLPRMWRLIRATEARYPRLPHRYLYAVGVDPGRQGRGQGSALVRAGLEACDRDRVPAYLESSKERNVPLYERYGFRVVERLDLGRGAPSMWLMWREPQ